jgi:hypothetical protein
MRQRARLTAGFIVGLGVLGGCLTEPLEDKQLPGGGGGNPTAGDVVSLRIIPLNVVIVQDDTLRMTTVIRTRDSTIVTRPITWLTTNEEIVSITPNGLITGVRPNATANITASVEGLTAVATVRVDPKPANIVRPPAMTGAISAR